MTSDLTIGPNQEAWLHLMETTDKPQGQGNLCRNGAYCCLGLACEAFLPAESCERKGVLVFWDGFAGAAPTTLVRYLALRDQFGSTDDPVFPSLIKMNDHLGMTFPQIAAAIRANPRRWFTEAR